MKLTPWGLMVLLLAPLGIASARQEQPVPPPSGQQEESPLAAAARIAREQKKGLPKAAKVWDNDTIAETTGRINVVGQAPAPEETPAAPETKPPAGEEKAPGKAAPGKAAIEAELAAAKEKLASLKTDLDIMQRKYTLDQQAYYGKPDYASDTAGAAALEEEKSQIDSKQQEVNDAQANIDELQEKLASIGAEGADSSSR